MNRHFSAIAAVAIALSATPALAADLLPLQRGFYVATDTPCGEASDATITDRRKGGALVRDRRWYCRTYCAVATSVNSAESS